MSLSTKLATLRISFGWSVEFVANQIGVSNQTVLDWEEGKEIPVAENLIRIKKLFGGNLFE